MSPKAINLTRPNYNMPSIAEYQHDVPSPGRSAELIDCWIDDKDPHSEGAISNFSSQV